MAFLSSGFPSRLAKYACVYLPMTNQKTKLTGMQDGGLSKSLSLFVGASLLNMYPLCPFLKDMCYARLRDDLRCSLSDVDPSFANHYWRNSAGINISLQILAHIVIPLGTGDGMWAGLSRWHLGSAISREAGCSFTCAWFIMAVSVKTK